MKRRRPTRGWRLPPTALSVVLAVICAGCEQQPPVTANLCVQRPVMGTVATLTVIAPDNQTAQAAIEAGFKRLDDVNRLMSDYDYNSEISRSNRTMVRARSAFLCSPETFHCIQKAVEVAEASGGAFDITCRPLVSLWRRTTKNNRLPTDEEIADARERVGWDKLRLHPQRSSVEKLARGMQIDLGGIAKGYALDLAAEAMKQAGATGGLVDVGGDIVAFGHREKGQSWRIGVRDAFNPDRQQIMLKLELTDLAVATSGVQERFFEIDGQRYSHIIDPRTGRPAEQAPSVTVIATDGITADAWATVFSVLTIAEGQALIAADDTPVL
ncbi:MAG: FAD:protein FMN transferase [Planctomycetota bacterium]